MIKFKINVLNCVVMIMILPALFACTYAAMMFEGSQRNIAIIVGAACVGFLVQKAQETFTRRQLDLIALFACLTGQAISIVSALVAFTAEGARICLIFAFGFAFLAYLANQQVEDNRKKILKR